MGRLSAITKTAAKDESGATLVEYGLLLLLISSVCLASIGKMGHTMRSVFNEIKDQFEEIVED